MTACTCNKRENTVKENSNEHDRRRGKKTKITKDLIRMEDTLKDDLYRLSTSSCLIGTVLACATKAPAKLF